MKHFIKMMQSGRGSLALSESLALKAVSLLLALILWVTILGFKKEEVRKNVKLEPLLPPGMVITNRIPSYVQFSFTGPRVLLKDVEKRLHPIRPDFRKTRETTIALTVNEDLLGELPVGVKVTGFYPPNIVVRLEEVVERYIPVGPVTKGALAPGFELGTVKAVPSKIAVSGPKSLVESMETVGTDPIDISGLDKTQDFESFVEVDSAQGLQLTRDKSVRVRIQTKRVLKEDSKR